MKWFKHDSDAHRDAKLRRLRRAHGLEGVGLYWWILELIVADVSESNLSFELDSDAELISEETGVPRERVEHIMRTMCDLGLFEQNDGIIRCLKLGQRLMQSQASTPKMRAMITQMNRSQEKYDGYVYLIQVGGDEPMIKIGKSKNPYSRLEELRRHDMVPEGSELVLLGKKYSDNAYEEEKALHHALKHLHIGREFFTGCREVLDAAESTGITIRHDVVTIRSDYGKHRLEETRLDKTRTEQNRTDQNPPCPGDELPTECSREIINFGGQK